MYKSRWQFTIYTLMLLSATTANGQSILPPEIDWHGKSESLISKKSNPWITRTEQTDFVNTPTYAETMSWLKKLAEASQLISMHSIGKSPEGRDVFMIIASTEKNISSQSLRKSNKPLLLVQAGIHSGEIDGKDAGMMLLRDIAFGNKKKLLDKVNLLFIPILNVDGHERSSAYNRPNQRGPQNQGWRTNAQNLNLNRDYTKIDTKEIRSVIKVLNDYDPTLYMDIHVTDGADYQYDITYGGLDSTGYSKNIFHWLSTTFKEYVDKDLNNNGHIPGQLLFAANDRDFSEGSVLLKGEPRFSDAYGDLRHLASVLVENHSLKPYKQRVLGTYVMIESTMILLSEQGNELKKITSLDRAKRETSLPMMWKIPQLNKVVFFDPQNFPKEYPASATLPNSLVLLGVESKLLKSKITNSQYVEWTGKPVTMTIPNYLGTEGVEFVKRPKFYYIPAAYTDLIERLQVHGIQMEIVKQPQEVIVEMYRMQNHTFQDTDGKTMFFEGHLRVNATPQTEQHKQVFATGSAIISTDQPLGDLAMLLLEPLSPDSYFQWGFFNTIFQRTEYIEAYVMEPTIKKMLEDSPTLQKEFEEKKAKDEAFAKDPKAIYNWFYSKTKYYDERFLLYPIGRVL